MVGIELSSLIFTNNAFRWDSNYRINGYRNMLYRRLLECKLSLSGLFYVNNFTGDLAGAVTVQDFECLDPTAALPTHKNASYEATVTEVNAAGGYIEYYVRVTPPGATDGVTRPDGEHLSGYQHRWRKSQSLQSILQDR